jgi:predicted NBD/HSP70 family sugar kinase
MDGSLHGARAVEFDTPATYEALIACAAQQARRLLDRDGVSTVGLGISVPGLVDYRHELAVLSPNLPITDGRSPSRDLAERLGVPCTLIQEEHALCLAERYYGGARGIDDFAVLDVSTGVGLGVMSGGRLLTGRSGKAGEIGHVTVQADGRPCGCGNHGCLETVACDSALAWMVSQRLGRKVSIEEVIEVHRSGETSLEMELETLRRYLGIGLAAIINLFNPSTLFVHGRLFEVDDSLFDRTVEEARRRSLGPSFEECRIVRSRASKRQGAVAAMVEHRIEAVGGAAHRYVRSVT